MSEKIYEMLWDCEYCGKKKLLGKTHRFCPGCGAPQDPARRYFPDDKDKVAVEDHEYFGADWHCPACKNAMSARVKFCGSCGAPKEGAAEVKRVGEASPPPPPPAAATARSRLGLWLGAGALVLAVPAFLFLRTKPVVVTVAGHSWQREAVVEKFGPVKRSAWCDAMPGGARSVTRTRKERDTEKVPDGEDCRPVKKDRGDGTYVESQDCTPRTRTRAIEDDWCEYTVDDWAKARTQRAQGRGLSPEPAWPVLVLEPRGEREGARSEAYTVVLEEGGKTHPCELPQAEWAAMAPGTRWSGRKRATGGLVCGGFTAAR